MTVSIIATPRSPIAWAALLFDSRLPADVKDVGAFLAERADDELVSSPGIAAIQQATGFKEHLVIRAMHDLQLAGFIEKIGTYKPFTSNSFDSYKLTIR